MLNDNLEDSLTAIFKKMFVDTPVSYTSSKLKDILMSTVGSLAELKLFWGNKGSIAQNIVAFRCIDPYISMYLYQYLVRKQHELVAYEIGSVQASIKVSQVVDYDIDIPPHELLEDFDNIATCITEQIYTNEAEIDICHRIQEMSNLELIEPHQNIQEILLQQLSS